MKMAPGGNNHGGLVFANGQYYIFYHRHTNGTSYSRQACAEPIAMEADGSFRQVEMTSCGLNGGPLVGKGYYPAYIACHVFGDKGMPKIMQDGRDGDENPGYVANITDTGTVGFKYFEFDGSVSRIKLYVRGYGVGCYEIKTAWDGEVLARVDVVRANVWEEFSAPITLPAGKHALYFTFRGVASSSLGGFELI